MLTVVGVKNKKGNYQGKDYDNWILHCEQEDGEAYGVVTEQIKVKASNVASVFGHSMYEDDWCELAESKKKIRVSYDKYGAVTDITIIEV